MATTTTVMMTQDNPTLLATELKCSSMIFLPAFRVFFTTTIRSLVVPDFFKTLFLACLAREDFLGAVVILFSNEETIREKLNVV